MHECNTLKIDINKWLSIATDNNVRILNSSIDSFWIVDNAENRYLFKEYECYYLPEENWQ